MNTMEIREILNYLPHRFPFLLIDRVVALEEGKSIVAIKNVAINEPFFQGHFPGHPVMPGVLILEAMAQAAAILALRTLNVKPDDKLLYYYAGIDNARFKRPVEPGDQMLVEVAILGSKRGIWKFGCAARVGEALVAEADILCTVRPVADQAK